MPFVDVVGFANIAVDVFVVIPAVVIVRRHAFGLVAFDKVGVGWRAGGVPFQGVGAPWVGGGFFATTQ